MAAVARLRMVQSRRPTSPGTPFEWHLESALRAARFQAWRMKLGGVIDSHEHPDIVHELAIAALQRWQHFDSSRSRASTFLDIVIKNSAKAAIRARFALKRKGDRRHISAGKEAAALPAPDEAPRLELQIDINDAILKLAPELQPFARAMKRLSPTAAARVAGISRKIAKEYIAKIQESFRSIGLEP